MHPALIPSTKYPASWYAAMRSQTPLRPRLASKDQTQICIIGAGLAGLSVGLELIRRGVPITIIEAGRVAWGASGRNGGFVSPGFAVGMEQIIRRVGMEQSKRLYQYSVMGTQRVRENVDCLVPECLMGEGELIVSRCSSDDEMTDYATLLNARFSESIETWSVAQVRQVLQSERYFQGLYNHSGFHIDPLNYALALAVEIENRGGKIFEDSAAISCDSADDGINIMTEYGSIKAEQVVVCTSGYDQGFYAPVSRSVLPVSTHIVVTAVLDEKELDLIVSDACIADTRNAGDYYRLVSEGGNKRLMWGGKISTLMTPPKTLNQIMRRSMTEVYPALKDVQIDYSWSGLMGYCRHKMPVVRQQKRDVWVVTAFGGHGLNTTAMAGVLVASAITEGDKCWQDFDSFGLQWGGGFMGQVGVQGSYWGLQLKDRIREIKSRANK